MCQAVPDDDDSVGQLEVGLFNLSRVRFRSAKQLPNLERFGFCVSRNAMLSYPKARIKDRMTVGVGGRVVVALRLTALMAVERFETYHHPLELAVARELPAPRYVSQGMSSS